MRSDAVPSIRPTVRYRPGVARPARIRPVSDITADKARFTVVGDWPDPVPVMDGEAAVIETYLSRFVDELLARSESAPTGKPHTLQSTITCSGE